MKKFFDGVNKNFGFGCMRMPMKDNEIDVEQVKLMVYEFISHGFNYFDTAHGYHSEHSEPTLKQCLTSRYPRESYILTDKLSDFYFHSQREIRPLFEEQLRCCGVDYFDFYLMHAQSRRNYDQYRDCHAYETAFALKAEGKVKHVGLSFHDTADFLDKILTDFPEIDVVQLQLNYLDWDDASVQARANYEVCVKHGKPVIVMEPVKGGRLADLPDTARKLTDALQVSPAQLALRFAASLPNVFMVLSGMSSIEQMKQNVACMESFRPLSEREATVAQNIAGILRGENMIPCTACRYCVDGCPKHIAIPDLFACLNGKRHSDSFDASGYVNILAKSGKASECIKCGKCERSCPQGLEIRKLLQEVAAQFE